MLILLPPSETKAFPAGPAPVDLGALALPGLSPTRSSLTEALTRLCAGPEPDALAALGISARQAAEVTHNARLLSAPAGPAAEVYTGVLYDALDLPSLHRDRTEPETGTGTGTGDVLIFSGLWGVLRPGDRIPHYRCSAGVKLPRTGSVSAAWKKALREPLTAHADGRLVVDLRSGAYAGLWTPGPNAVTVRVLHEKAGQRSVVSHFNKATKGRLARALLTSGQRPGKPDEFADAVRDLGYTVEPGPPARYLDAPLPLDIVVREL